MMRRLLFSPFLALSLVGLMGLSPLEPSAEARVATAYPPDTLRSSVNAGTPLVLSLPAELGNAPVTRYSVLKGPALSGLAGHSFTWITRSTDPGTYDVLLRATYPDAAPDTLVVQVTIQ